MTTLRHLLLVLLLSTGIFCGQSNAQKSILTAVNKPIAGMRNTYQYRPGNNVNTRNKKLFATYVYGKNDRYHFVIVPMERVGDQYFFSIKVPDSISVLVLEINDSANITVDDHDGVGYLSFLYHDLRDTAIAIKYIDANYLLSYFAPQALNLRRDRLKQVMINLFEKAYKVSPAIREYNMDMYWYYLTLLNEKSPDSTRKTILSFADEMGSDQRQEGNWQYAIKAYRLLGMTSQQHQIENKAVKLYHDGTIARDIFLDTFYQKKDGNETSILGSIEEFKRRFNDSSASATYPFFLTLMQYFIGQKKWDKLLEYEPLFSNKLTLSQLYSWCAYSLCGDGIDTPGQNLDTARLFAQKAIGFISDTLHKLLPTDNGRFLMRILDDYTDVYALVFYKRKQFDSAFYYQQQIVERKINLSADYLERYVIYSMKVKDPSFSKRIIEEKFSDGIISPKLISLLISLYSTHGSNSEISDQIWSEYGKLLTTKSDQMVQFLFGSDNAPDFTLKTLNNREITLSSLRGKTVILDFWATWCGPCLAAFPKMQELVDKYTPKHDVVFLFVNSFEVDEPDIVRKKTEQLLHKNNYTFNVLVDGNNQVATKYKVESLPTTVVISKEHKIRFIGDDVGGLTYFIKEAINEAQHK